MKLFYSTKKNACAAFTYKNITAKNPADKAELSKSYFTSVFVPSQSTFDIDTSLDSFDSNTQISDIEHYFALYTYMMKFPC